MHRIGDGMPALLKRLKANAEKETPAHIKEAIARHERVMMRSRVLDSGMPTKWSNFLIDGEGPRGEGWRETDAVCKLATAAADPVNRVIVLLGPTRTGKSLAAAWWLSQQEGSRFWASAPAFINAPAKKPISLRSLDTTSLVLDDVGLDTEAEWASQKIETLVFEREGREEAKTLITSNLFEEKFRDRYRDRIYNRILESGCFLECTTKEVRLK